MERSSSLIVVYKTAPAIMVGAVELIPVTIGEYVRKNVPVK